MATLSPYNATTGITPTDLEYVHEIGLKTILEAFVLGICGTVGIVGNGTLMLIVLLNADMRNVPNTLIACLALGDFVFLIWCVPFTIASYCYQYYPFSNLVCKISTVVPFLSEGVSVLTLAALSFDRYNAIVRPMHRRRSNAVRQTYLLAFIIWVFSTVLAIPGFVLAEVNHEFGMPFCLNLPHGSTIAIVHEAFRFVVLYVFPLIIISLFYTFVALQLMASSRDMPGESRGDATKQVKARRRLARAVIVLVALFAICWLPHFIYQFIFQAKFPDFNFLGSVPMTLLQTVAHMLIYINSSINPIAMCFLSKTYRRYFARYLCCCLKSGQQDKGQHGLLSKTGVNGTNTKWTTEGSGQPSVIETKTALL